MNPEGFVNPNLKADIDRAVDTRAEVLSRKGKYTKGYAAQTKRDLMSGRKTLREI